MKTFGKIILVLFIIALIAGNVVFAKMWYDTNKNLNDEKAKLQEMETSYQEMEDSYVKASTQLADMSKRSEEIDKAYNRKLENVKLEVVENSVTKTGLELIITDTSDLQYPWDNNYYLEKKVNESWEKVNPIKEAVSEVVTYKVDENKQIKQVIDWTETYGTLESGTYRVWKNIKTPASDINVESNEFVIE